MSPPAWWLCSRTRTRWPRWHSSDAATSPAIPAPTTIASKRPSAAARASLRAHRRRLAHGVAVRSRARESVPGAELGDARQPVRNIARRSSATSRRELLRDRLDRPLGGAQERQRERDRVGAERERLRDLDPVADAARRDDHPVCRERRRQATMLSAVGIPQRAKSSPRLRRAGSAARRLSTCDQEVPPTPGGLDARHGSSRIFSAVLRERPEPTSFSSTGTPSSGITARSFGRRAAKRVSPSWLDRLLERVQVEVDIASVADALDEPLGLGEAHAVVELHRAEVPEEEREVGGGLADRVGVRERRHLRACAAATRARSPTPQRAAATARRRFISSARGVPPVMAPITMGAARRLPRSSASV